MGIFTTNFMHLNGSVRLYIRHLKYRKKIERLLPQRLISLLCCNKELKSKLSE